MSEWAPLFVASPLILIGWFLVLASTTSINHGYLLGRPLFLGVLSFVFAGAFLFFGMSP